MLTRDDDRQETLPLRVPRVTGGDVTDETIRGRSGLLSAINLCIAVSGLQDNEVAAEIGMDEGQFSRCRKGTAHFPPDKIDVIEDVCGNEIPTRFKALSRGYGLVRLKSFLEEENEGLRSKLAEAELKLEHFKEFQTMRKEPR